MPRSAGAKPLEWARAARDAFDASIDFIASEDAFTARLVVERAEDALKQIQAYPRIGGPAGVRGRRAFPIPNTGHISTIARPRARSASCAGIAASRTRLDSHYARLLTGIGFSVGRANSVAIFIGNRAAASSGCDFREIAASRSYRGPGSRYSAMTDTGGSVVPASET